MLRLVWKTGVLHSSKEDTVASGSEMVNNEKLESQLCVIFYSIFDVPIFF